MRTNYFFCCFFVNIFFIATNTFSQATNFDETWKEFLDNDKISNMSELIRPNKVYEQPEYAKYLLMNTNSDFCQSDIDKAERLMTEVQAMDPALHKSIPGFILKMDALDAKIKAFHSMDEIWQRFLDTRQVSLDELDAIVAAKSSCEKSTLAKYSYMTAYQHFCEGDIAKSKDIFENRTLRLTEKTTLRVRDVKGLEEEVAKMKSLYRDMAQLDVAWKKYVDTGVSPGFNTELPLFPCNPIPNMKVVLLNGVFDLCSAAPAALARIKELETQTGVAPNRDLRAKIRDVEAAIGKNNASVAVLNEAWEAFIPDNKVRHMGKYGHKYCDKESLIRAYIMDGFSNVCQMGEEMLEKIDSLQRPEITPLQEITMIKINQLAAESAQFQTDGVNIERLWRNFVAQGDQLTEQFQSPEYYCDNIHQVKDWTIRGLSGSCEDGNHYLQEIEEFQRTFEFNFTKELECRVQKLRIKVWDCRYQALEKLARVEASEDAYEKRLKELMAEYGMSERPEVCPYE